MSNEESEDGQERYENEISQLHTVVGVLKREKKNAKSNLTRMLNQFVVLITDEKYDRHKIVEGMECLVRLREEVMKILEELETVYSKLQDKDNERKTSNEIDEVNEQVDRELSEARVIMLAQVSNMCRAHNVISEEKEKVQRTSGTKEVEEDTRLDNRVPSEERRPITIDSPAHSHPHTPTSHTSNLHGGDLFGFSNAVNGQLERIKIPVFGGNKLEFPRWHAAFSSCVDSSSLSSQFKMLRLEGCLTGEAAETVKGLGYSEAAYETANARLLRKYGGNRRQVQGHLEELKKMKILREDDAKALEKFADALERAVVTLKENDRQSELQDGTLYTIILEKIPEKLLAQYYRWINENQERESLEKLKDWIAEEAEYRVQAAEIRNGIGSDEKTRERTVPWKRSENYAKSFVSSREGVEPKVQICKLCGHSHPIWHCEVFKEKPIERRWETAKRLGLCYRCLSNDHLGSSCPNYRECKIDGCKDTHHRLLHVERATPRREKEYRSVNGTNPSPQVPGHETKTAIQESKEGASNANQTHLSQESVTPQTTEGDASTHTATMETAQKREKVVALQTVPLILKNGNKRLLVNCFLDEGSDTTYINEDVVEELGVRGRKEPITVNVANDKQVKFMSMTFQVGVESIDGKLKRTISAKTSQKICGGMKPVNWLKIKHKWFHLSDIPFPELAQRRTIDVLLGADNHELMAIIKEVPGDVNEPSARLCPLGWTAIGRIDKEDLGEGNHTGLIRTFRIQQSEETSATQDDDLNVTLRKFWELEHIGILSSKKQFTQDEQAAWEKVSESRTFDGKRYQVAVPWKEERPCLVSNRPLAERRLQQVERKLAKDEKIATAYQQVIDEYLQKNYIRRVLPTEEKNEVEWLLPHFPVIRPDRATTKVRIVFDASATYQGRSLNTETLPGPKLQSNIFDILVRFRKELVALAGDVSQMYHQLVLQPVDRPFHRFLWRDLDPRREPETYEFQRFVFGGCYCPFCAQYVWQQHARDHKDQYPLAAEAVEKNCYMDDLMPSVKNVEEAKTMRKQITELGDKAGFHVRKWISHRPEVLEDIPEQDRAAEIDLSKTEFPVTKTLGVLWIAQEDKFSFRYSAPAEEFVFTKRSVLKKTATIFDPLGFLIPFTVRGKLLMQEAWTEAVNMG